VCLSGFEPLTLSMRTLGTEVARGRWGRSLVGGSRSKAFPVAHVADLSAVQRLASLRRGTGEPRIKSLSGASSPGFMDVRAPG
jgi:hypothetical protein